MELTKITPEYLTGLDVTALEALTTQIMEDQNVAKEKLVMIATEVEKKSQSLAAKNLLSNKTDSEKKALLQELLGSKIDADSKVNPA